MMIRGEYWERKYAQQLRITNKRNGCALGIADLCDLGKYPICGKNLRRFRRLDKMAKKLHRILFEDPRRVEPETDLTGIV